MFPPGLLLPAGTVFAHPSRQFRAANNNLDYYSLNIITITSS
jgi:hypothetical protein